MPRSSKSPLVTCIASDLSIGFAGTPIVQMCEWRSVSTQPELPLERYTARVMTLTSVLCGDGAADDSGFFRSSAVVDETNAIVLPSGDQTGPLAPRGRSVSARASPPSRDNK